ncbi:hypothetical protein H5410_049555 [Solanum commersonii]|uniref:Uncharacterized protein n=1 Tax=Solanum commersonii TaxID=4109 RepID=A0A9J5WVC0_SOLCO|nr:hypothetical protein H5410_049555 [Solanum commersonii]
MSQSAFLSSSSSDKFSKPRVVKSTNSRRRVVSVEIISINKDPTYEALIELTVGFSYESLMNDEIEIRVVSLVAEIEHDNYILIRNMFIAIIPEHCNELLDSVYNYLLSYGYINFGVALAIKYKIPVEL